MRDCPESLIQPELRQSFKSCQKHPHSGSLVAVMLLHTYATCFWNHFWDHFWGHHHTFACIHNLFQNFLIIYCPVLTLHFTCICNLMRSFCIILTLVSTHTFCTHIQPVNIKQRNAINLSLPYILHVYTTALIWTSSDYTLSLPYILHVYTTIMAISQLVSTPTFYLSRIFLVSTPTFYMHIQP